MTRSTLQVATPDGEMPAHLWLPEAGSGPGILLLQEIFGISRYVESRAQDLADLGYVVLGVVLARSDRPRAAGAGVAVVVQGAFLLLHDSHHAWRARTA